MGQVTMMNKLLVAASLLFAACIDNTDTDRTIDTGAAGDDVASTDSKTDDDAPLARTDDHDVPACSLTVATDGPCAVACDPEQVMTFVPAGTCTTFLCDLEDGSQFRTGGCNL
jgi:hypothetical protein